MYFEDGINVRTDSVTRVNCGGITYNAVLSVSFSAESANESITVQEAKDWIRVDVSDDDTIILKLITAARRICEKYVNMSLIARTVTAKINNGLGNFYLPYGPVVAITSATDYYSNDITTGFSLDTVYGNALTIVYTAGYADGLLPEELRTAILDQIAWMYTNRGDVQLASALSLESMLTLKPLRFV